MKFFLNIWNALKSALIAIRKRKQQMMRLYVTIIAGLLISGLVYSSWDSSPTPVSTPTVSYTEFMKRVESGQMEEVWINLEQLSARLKDGTFVNTRIDSKLANPIADFRKYGVTVVFSETELSPDVASRKSYISFAIFAIVALWVFLFFWGIGPRGEIKLKFWSRVQHVDSQSKVSFADVAGIDEVRDDVQEVVDYLKDPAKFEGLGGQIPRGVLLIGPPGGGKTLLARAMAGEAKVPFFAMAGSDFMELYVGVGARRVRDLFARAKSSSPSIVYIDEIDSVGSRRGTALSGGDRESQQTLIALLNELDGFERNSGIVFIASTNNPDNLDDALMRKGRLDRHIVVPYPDAKGRQQILNVHVRLLKVPLAPDVDLSVVALGTPGFSGADLANLVNEAALCARRENPSGKKVFMRHFSAAKEKVLLGTERKSLELSAKDELLIAIHEFGHAIVAMRTEGADPVDKISIKPRGKSLGVMIQIPSEDRVHYSKKYLLARLAVMMGGRAAEEIFYSGNVTAGAEDDIDKASTIASMMVTRWGMSDKIGPLSLKKRSGGAFLNRGDSGVYDCSAELAAEADAETQKLLNEALAAARCIIETEREGVERGAKVLMSRKELNSEEILLLLSGRELPQKDFSSQENS